MESATGVVINYNEEGKSDDITYQNRACRYIIAMKKFVLKDNTEMQLRPADKAQVFELLKKLQEHAASRRVKRCPVAGISGLGRVVIVPVDDSFASLYLHGIISWSTR
jgi:hypothetical protein